jgi:hypothetical protein
MLWAIRYERFSFARNQPIRLSAHQILNTFHALRGSYIQSAHEVLLYVAQSSFTREPILGVGSDSSRLSRLNILTIRS